MKKAILHVMNYAAVYRGNFIDSLESLNKELREVNAENIYVFPKSAAENNSNIWIEELKAEGRECHYLTERFFQDVRFLRKLISDKQITIVHTHFITMKQFLLVNQAIKGTEAKIVMHFHNHAGRSSNRLKNALKRFIYRKCVMIGVSASVATELKEVYPKNTVYEVDNAINFCRLDRYENLDRKTYSIQPNERICLMFGFDFYRKGVDLAVKAIEKVRANGEKVVLLISLSSNMESVKENIKNLLGEFPDWIKLLNARNDVASYYGIADVFLSPSREEGFCYSAVEAAYCGCQVVASRIPAQENLEIPNALWFESENTQMLAERIKNTLQREPYKTDESIQEFLKKRYDLRQWAKQVIKIYDTIG